MRRLFSAFSRHSFRNLPARVLVSAAALALAASAGAQVTQTSIELPLTGPWSTAATGPVGIAVDPAGNIYVSEHVRQDIVRLDAKTHAASAFATACNGTPLGRVQYMTADAAGSLYVADPTNSAIEVFSTTSGQCTAQYSASGAAPFGVALDSSGNLFYTTYNLTGSQAVGVYKVPAGSPGGTAGSPVITFGITNAAGIAFDPATGDMLVADRDANTVNRYTAASGFSTAGSQTYLSGVGQPYGLLFDARGNLLVAESGSGLVERYAFPSATNPVELTPSLQSATGIGRDAQGNLYVASYGGSSVVEFSSGLGMLPVNTTSATAGVNFTVQPGTTIGAISILSQGASGGEFAAPATDANSNLCTARLYSSAANCSVDLTFTPAAPGRRLGAVQLLDNAAHALATAFVSGIGTGPQLAFAPGAETTVPLGGGLARANVAATDSAGNIYLGGADAGGNYLILRLAAGGAATVVASQSTGTLISSAHGIAVDGSGNVLVAGTLGSNSAVLFKESPVSGGYAESVLTLQGAGTGGGTLLAYAYGIAVDGSGNLFVAGIDAAGLGLIAKESPQSTGAYAESTVAGASTGSALTTPEALALDSAGDVFATDITAGAPIREEVLSPYGTWSEISLTPQTGAPAPHTFLGIAVDPHGDLFVADSANSAIFKEQLSGAAYIESRVSTSALSMPYGVTLDSLGNLYIADLGNKRVLKENYAGAPSLHFSATALGSTAAAPAITLANQGNAALTFPAIATANPALSGDFTLDGAAASACLVVSAAGAPSTLPAGADCTLTLGFAPTSTGNLSGSLLLTDTEGNATAPGYATQTIALSGTATPAAAQVLVSALPPSGIAGQPFGSVTAAVADSAGNTVPGASATVTLTITGPAGYHQSQNATAVSGVAAFLFQGSAPTAAGVYTFSASAGGLTTGRQTLTVTAAAPAKLVLGGVSSSLVAGANLGTLPVTVDDTYGNQVQNSSAAVTAALTAPDGSSKSVTAHAANGQASLDLSGIALTQTGSYTLSVTAQGVTASQVTIQVAPAPAPPDFTLGVTTGTPATSGPVAAGQSATYSLTLAPTGSSYSSPVTLTATGLPAGATATFSPATITPGAKSATITLTIQTAVTTARLHPAAPASNRSPWRSAPVALGVLLLPMAGLRRGRGMLRLLVFAGLLALTGTVGLTGCGGGLKSTTTTQPQPTSYQVTVTAASGSLAHSINVTFIQQ